MQVASVAKGNYDRVRLANSVSSTEEHDAGTDGSSKSWKQITGKAGEQIVKAVLKPVV